MSRWFFVLLRRTSRRFFLSLQELPLRRRAAHLAEPGPWAAPDGGRLGAQGAARPRRKDGDRDTGTGTRPGAVPAHSPQRGRRRNWGLWVRLLLSVAMVERKVSVKGKFQKKKKKGTSMTVA